MSLVEAVYCLTKRFPKEEIYILTAQMRRAAISIPSNLAEGQGRESRNEFRHHVTVSQGSLNELETQILVAERLGYVDHEKAAELLPLTSEIGRILCGLRKSLR